MSQASIFSGMEGPRKASLVGAIQPHEAVQIVLQRMMPGEKVTLEQFGGAVFSVMMAAPANWTLSRTQIDRLLMENATDGTVPIEIRDPDDEDGRYPDRYTIKKLG